MKVGDRVRIKTKEELMAEFGERWNRGGNSNIITADMEYYLGRYTTILNIDDEDDVDLAIDGSEWYWDLSWLVKGHDDLYNRIEKLLTQNMFDAKQNKQILKELKDALCKQETELS